MPEQLVLLIVEDHPAHAALVREAMAERRPDIPVHDVPGVLA